MQLKSLAFLVALPFMAFPACRVQGPTVTGIPVTITVPINGKPYTLKQGTWSESVVCDSAKTDTAKAAK